jgi:hypothetical protein
MAMDLRAEETTMNDETFAMFELEPLSTATDRRVETGFHETVLGKRNRISIGHPTVRKLEEPTADGLLTGADLEGFAADARDFWSVELSLTLLPDRGCRFSSADFSIALSPVNEDLPIIRRFLPDRKASLKTVRVERTRDASAGMSENVLQLVEVGASTGRSQSEEWKGSVVHLESFGAGTREGGWRFTVTAGTEIPLTTTGLRLLCLLPRGEGTVAKLKLVAGIDIRSAVDRWVTAAFRGRQYGIEATLDIG